MFASLLSHDSPLDSAQKLGFEKELFQTLRELNLATWCMSACEMLASHSVLAEGAEVRVHGLQSRADLNGQVGRILGRAPKVAGRAPRWRVRVAGHELSIRSRNLGIERLSCRHQPARMHLAFQAHYYVWHKPGILPSK